MSNIALSEEYQLFINGKYKGELKSPEVTLGLIEHDEIKIKEEEGQSYLQALASNMDEKDIVKKYFALQGVYVVSSNFDERGEFGMAVVLPPHLASSALIATTYQKITIESLRLKFKNQAFLVTQPLDAEILGDSLSYAHDHIITQDPDFEFLNNTPYKSSLMDWRVMYWGTVPGAFPEGDVKLMCLNTFYYLCVMMNESYKGPTIKGMLPVHRKPTQREINQLKLRPIYSMQGKAFNTPYAIPIPIPDKILKVMSNFSEIMEGTKTFDHTLPGAKQLWTNQQCALGKCDVKSSDPRSSGLLLPKSILPETPKEKVTLECGPTTMKNYSRGEFEKLAKSLPTPLSIDPQESTRELCIRIQKALNGIVVE